MTVEMLGDVLQKLKRDSPSMVARVSAAQVAGLLPDNLLKARIIRGTCPTCGGSKEVGTGSHYACEGVGETVDNSEIMEPCPDCADAPITVIEPAAMEAFVCALAGYNECSTRDGAKPLYANATDPFPGSPPFEKWWAMMEKQATKFLQALLPGARVADHEITVTAPPNIGVDYGADVGTLYAGDKIFVKLGDHR